MLLISLGELSDDDTTLTAEGEEVTPRSRHYQPAIDLTRFQKLIEIEGSASEMEEENRPRIANNQHTPLGQSEYKHTRTSNSKHSNTGPIRARRGSEPHHFSRPEDIPRSVERPSERQNHEQEEDSDSSDDGMSELSSIPPAPEADDQANLTVDSEASSLHHAGGSGKVAKSTVRRGERVGLGQGVELDRRMPQGQVTPSAKQHPLHVVHKMSALSHRTEQRERKEDVSGQEKVHDHLRDLEQVQTYIHVTCTCTICVCTKTY